VHGYKITEVVTNVRIGEQNLWTIYDGQRWSQVLWTVL